MLTTDKATDPLARRCARRGNIACRKDVADLAENTGAVTHQAADVRAAAGDVARRVGIDDPGVNAVVVVGKLPDQPAGHIGAARNVAGSVDVGEYPPRAGVSGKTTRATAAGVAAADVGGAIGIADHPPVAADQAAHCSANDRTAAVGIGDRSDATGSKRPGSAGHGIAGNRDIGQTDVAQETAG